FVQSYGIFSRATDVRGFQLPCPKLCVARWLVEEVARAGAPREQIEHVPYGLDHARFRVTDAIAGRPPRISMLYNAHPLKGAALGIKAIELVRLRMPEVEAVLFGTKEPAHEIPSGIAFVQDPPRDVLVRDVYNGSSV